MEDASFQAGLPKLPVCHEPDADDFQSMRNVTIGPDAIANGAVIATDEGRDTVVG